MHIFIHMYTYVYIYIYIYIHTYIYIYIYIYISGQPFVFVICSGTRVEDPYDDVYNGGQEGAYQLGPGSVA